MSPANHDNRDSRLRGRPADMMPYALDTEPNSDQISSDMIADFHALNPGLPSVERRFYFPETWIWTTQPIG